MDCGPGEVAESEGRRLRAGVVGGRIVGRDAAAAERATLATTASIDAIPTSAATDAASLNG